MNKVDDTEQNGGELDDALRAESAESGDRPKGKKRKAENPEEREARLKREATELEQAIQNFVVAGTIKTRVAWILNMFPQTRDSDIALSLKYWELYRGLAGIRAKNSHFDPLRYLRSFRQRSPPSDRPRALPADGLGAKNSHLHQHSSELLPVAVHRC